MSNQDNQLQNIKRNSFIALCDFASHNNWCWKLACSTCGNSDFRVAFSKIARNQHPDDEAFWTHCKGNRSLLKEADDYRDFFGNVSVATQMKLASIVAGAKVADIQTVAKFPDWLGYIGLVIYHCPNRDSRRIISNAFLHQFITMVKNNEEIYKYLQEKQLKQELLNIDDLSKIERACIY